MNINYQIYGTSPSGLMISLALSGCYNINFSNKPYSVDKITNQELRQIVRLKYGIRYYTANVVNGSCIWIGSGLAPEQIQEPSLCVQLGGRNYQPLDI